MLPIPRKKTKRPKLLERSGRFLATWRRMEDMMEEQGTTQNQEGSRPN